MQKRATDLDVTLLPCGDEYVHIFLQKYMQIQSAAQVWLIRFK